MKALLALAITLVVAAAASAEPIRVTKIESGILDSESDVKEEDGLTLGNDDQDLHFGEVGHVLGHLTKRSPKIKKKLKKLKKLKALKKFKKLKLLKKFKKLPKKFKKLPKKLKKLPKKLKKLPKKLKKLPKALGAATLSAPLAGVPLAAGGTGGLLGGLAASAAPTLGAGFGIPAIIAGTGFNTGVSLAGALT